MARWLIDKAGVQITVHSKSDEANELINLTLSAIKTRAANTNRGIKITIRYEDDEWFLNDHESNLKRKLSRPGDLVYHLTDRIVFHLATTSKNVHCLYSAAVACGESALVIPANSGAGKSSFTVWLVANGFDYLTDELILIDDERQLNAVARPIQIKPSGMDAIDPLIESHELVQEGKVANAIPVQAVGGQVSAHDRHRLAIMVFPKYKADYDYEFTRMSSAQAGLALMANHVNARNLEGHGFREMMAIIRDTPCYALNYGGFASLPDNFSDQLKELINQAH